MGSILAIFMQLNPKRDNNYYCLGFKFNEFNQHFAYFKNIVNQ